MCLLEGVHVNVHNSLVPGGPLQCMYVAPGMELVLVVLVMLPVCLALV